MYSLRHVNFTVIFQFLVKKLSIPHKTFQTLKNTLGHKHPLRQRNLFHLIFVTNSKFKEQVAKRKDLILVAFTNEDRGVGKPRRNARRLLEGRSRLENPARKRKRTKNGRRFSEERSRLEMRRSRKPRRNMN